MPRHPLVTLGDSLTHGFMSGAISRTDIAYPVFLADALGARDEFRVSGPFMGEGGLPLNLERLVRRLQRLFGGTLNWWELLPAAAVVRELLDDTEDYWERGRGTWPRPAPETYHNLAVWGYEVQDAHQLTEGVIRRALPPAKDNFLKQVPEMSMYRTARLVVNPTLSDAESNLAAVDRARQLGDDGGIERLVVGLGANNALGTVLSLSIVDSEAADLERLRHERRANLYRPHHFEILYRQLAERLETVDAEHVVLLTVPHVTIPPVTRGVSPGGSDRDDDGLFEFYTRPWIWDDEFDPDRHPFLDRNDARRIDQTIDAYNETIRSVADERGWHVADMAQLVDDLAFRRSGGNPAYQFPAGLVAALRADEDLSYLVDKDGTVHLDTRFFVTDRDAANRVFRGGLFSLDGIHPTTIGYGLLADLVLKTLKDAGAAPEDAEIPWADLIAADELVGKPPKLVDDLQKALGHLERLGLLQGIFDQLN